MKQGDWIPACAGMTFVARVAYPSIDVIPAEAGTYAPQWCASVIESFNLPR